MKIKIQFIASEISSMDKNESYWSQMDKAMNQNLLNNIKIIDIFEFEYEVFDYSSSLYKLVRVIDETIGMDDLVPKLSFICENINIFPHLKNVEIFLLLNWLKKYHRKENIYIFYQ
jgi:hypothetical protein